MGTMDFERLTIRYRVPSYIAGETMDTRERLTGEVAGAVGIVMVNTPLRTDDV